MTKKKLKSDTKATVAASSNEEVFEAISADLKQSGTGGFTKVVNDSARKTFTTNKDGAVFEFSHTQPDSGYWNGTKYYGNGSSNRIRIKRTQDQPA